MDKLENFNFRSTTKSDVIAQQPNEVSIVMVAPFSKGRATLAITTSSRVGRLAVLARELSCTPDDIYIIRCSADETPRRLSTGEVVHMPDVTRATTSVVRQRMHAAVGRTLNAKLMRRIDARVRAPRGVVVICCPTGTTRAPAVAIAYLVAARGLALGAAMEAVRDARPCAWVGSFLKVISDPRARAARAIVAQDAE